MAWDRGKTARLVLLALCAWLFASQAVAQGPNFEQLAKQILEERSLESSRRLATIQQLHSFDNSESRGFLLRLLRREKGVEVRKALLGLAARYQHASITKCLRGELRNPVSPDTHWIACWHLAHRGDASVQVLVRSLPATKTAQYRNHIYSALGGAVKSQRARRALLRALDTESPEQQVNALRALAGFEPTRELTRRKLKCLDPSNSNLLAEALRQLAAERNPVVRDAALDLAADLSAVRAAGLQGAVSFALATALDQETLAPLMSLAADVGAVSWDFKRFNWLTAELSAEFIRAMAELLPQLEFAEDRTTAVRLLALLDHGSATTPLVSALGDRDDDVVKAALRALRKRGADCAEELETLTRANNPEHAAEAITALHRISKNNADWSQKLLGHLRSPLITVRLCAMDLLADLKHQPALEVVHERFAASHFAERAAAYAFCEAVRDKSSVPLLIERLGREEGRLFFDVMQTLRSLTGKGYRNAVYWERWWAAAGASFEVVAAEKQHDPAEPATGTLTYHGIPLHSKRVGFVVDVSGSMKEETGTGNLTRLRAAKQALLKVIEECEDDVHFNIVTFSGEVDTWAEEVRQATEQNRKEATLFVEELTAGGGTNMHAALEIAFEDEGVDTIYLLSDGDPSAGALTDAADILDEVAGWNRERRIVIHTIAIGQERELMKQLARATRGTYVRRI